MQIEEGDECPHPDPRDWQFVLLLRVTQANGQATAHRRIHKQGHGTNDM